jgi:hypothetical protein
MLTQHKASTKKAQLLSYYLISSIRVIPHSMLLINRPCKFEEKSKIRTHRNHGAHEELINEKIRRQIS